MHLDHFEPAELAIVARKPRELNPRLVVGVAGGITLATVKDYAPLADIIVLSAVLYAPPRDITCKMTRQ